jgi:HPt (histidine-containing phosphotransfer) domain-containing protein
MSEPLISTLGDDPDLGALVDDYVAALAGRIADIEGAMAAGDLRRAEMLAHQLVGSAGMHGFQTIGEAALRVEDAAHRGSLDVLVTSVRALAALCARARAR